MLRRAYSQSRAACLEALQSSETGLTEQEATQRRRKYGANKLPTKGQLSVWRLFIHQFKSPLIYILCIAGVIAVAMEETAGAVFIVAVLLINAVIGTVQEYSANNAAAALKKMITPLARVAREGRIQEIKATKLVMGDIVHLESGNKVPADMRLLSCQNLKMDESLLTGESVPVAKKADMTLPEKTASANRHNMVFAGSIVTQGRAVGVVCATAAQTRIGVIARQVTRKSRVQSPLVIRMERFTVKISVFVGLLVAVISAILYMQGESPQHIFLLAIGIAVSAIPEGLPVTLTIALAIGMRRMAKRHVIVRKLPAVESLGSCTMIASDKTGTLTQNELAVTFLAIPTGPIVAIPSDKRQQQGKPKRLSCMDLLEPEEQHHQAIIWQLMRAALLANEAHPKKEAKDPKAPRKTEEIFEGDAVDVALMQLGQKLGFERADLIRDNPQKAIIPYEPQQKFSASIHQLPDNLQQIGGKETQQEDGAPPQEKYLICVKGATEIILGMCRFQLGLKGPERLHPEVIETQAQALSTRQCRVLSYAYGYVMPKENPEESYTVNDLTELVFLGLSGMGDPLRPEAKEAIAQCHQAGIKVVMITGDHPDTAFAIAKSLDLSTDPQDIITGPEITECQQHMTEESAQQAALDQLITKESSFGRVYARVEPGQKLEIVDSLMRSGEFVAVTGDGVNDAPALKNAHVGVAMGQKGTDVARESADIILTDDNFSSIVAGIKQGRVAYNNIRKIVFFLIATSAAELAVFLGAIIMSLPIPLFATQLLWLNFVTSIIQDVAHAFNPPEGNELSRPPRRPNEAIFDSVMIQRILIIGGVMGAISFIEFYWMTQIGGYDAASARNILLLQFVLFENVIALNTMSERTSFFSQSLGRNPLLIFGTIGAQLLHIGAMYTPYLSDILFIKPVSLLEWGVLCGAALLVMVAMELEKFIRRKLSPLS